MSGDPALTASLIWLREFEVIWKGKEGKVDPVESEVWKYGESEGSLNSR